jgi:SAM-dependent methyltransferase/uncharacterized protein YbaR (Trm112 family)
MTTPQVDPHDLIPPPTHDRVDPFVQRWIGGTNGRLYVPLINKLPRYPIGRWPGKPASRPSSLLLDIGCGWGRWLVAAGQSGYCPVGIDVKIDALQASRRVMKHHGVRGYVVKADLKQLPFATGAFDQIYSYSVIQHVHREFARKCIAECARILTGGGQVLLEFPVSHGITNFRYGRRAEEEDYESWCVRYYSFEELRSLFASPFEGFSLEVDCYFGIGVRPEDLDLLPWRYKGVVVLSEIFKAAARLIRPLERISDSVFVHAHTPAGTEPAPARIEQPSGDGNMGILPVLRCPVTGGRLEYDQAGSRLISRDLGKAYPVVDEIPVMVASEAVPL